MSRPHNETTDEEQTMRKLLQNTFFAAMLAWALQGIQAHLEQSSIVAGMPVNPSLQTQVAWQP
jgi:hypothetical protein